MASANADFDAAAKTYWESLMEDGAHSGFNFECEAASSNACPVHGSDAEDACGDETDGKNDESVNPTSLFEKYGPPYDTEELKIEATTEGLHVYDGSICKIVVRPGTGPVVEMDFRASIRYRGFVDLCDEPFDSSFARRLKSFVVGGNEVLLGLDLAVLSMKCREVSLFIMDPALAFGEVGCLVAGIPPGATVVFEVELVRLTDPTKRRVPAVDGVAAAESVPPENDDSKPSADVADDGRESRISSERDGSSSVGDVSTLDDVLHAVQKMIKNFEREPNPDKALGLYRKAENSMAACRMESDAEEAKWEEVLKRLYAKGCVVAENNGNPRVVTSICRSAVQRFPNEGKFYYRWGKAICALASKRGDFDHAIGKFIEALKRATIPSQRSKIEKEMRRARDMLELVDHVFSPNVSDFGFGRW